MQNMDLVIPTYIVPPDPPLVETLENYVSEILTLWHLGYNKNIIICSPVLTWNPWVYNLFSVGRGAQNVNIWTSNGGVD